MTSTERSSLVDPFGSAADDAELDALLAEAREQIAFTDWNGYKPFDQSERIRHWVELRAPGERENDPERNAERVSDIAEWEKAHGHDVRLKCYPEFECSAIEAYYDHLLARLVAAVDGLRKER